MEFVDYHIGAPVVKHDADNESKYVRKIQNYLEIFRYKASISHKLAFIKYKQFFGRKCMSVLEITDKMNHNPELECLGINGATVIVYKLTLKAENWRREGESMSEIGTSEEF